MKSEHSRGTLIELVPRGAVDFAKLAVDYANGRPVDLSGYEVYQLHSFLDFREEFLDHIAKHGLGALARIERLEESVVPPNHPVNQIEALVKRFVQALGNTDELIIVDPYFYKATNPSYPVTVENILSPLFPSLKRLLVVTGGSNKVVPSTKLGIESRLGSLVSGLTVDHGVSDKFHDRFWISRTSETGFLTGTSLNGLGKRYALIDRLQKTDVQEILAALGSEGLL